MIGPRIGARVGPRVGLAVGAGDDETGTLGFSPVVLGPGSVALVGQSNALGIGVATSMAGFPGIDAAYPNVTISRYGAILNPNPTWTQDSPRSLQPRVNGFGSFVTGTCGVELTMGRDLDAASSGWNIIQFGQDGISMANMLSPTYLTVGPAWFDKMTGEIDTQIAASSKPLMAMVIVQGEADAGSGVDAANYYANLNTFCNRVRYKYGDIALVIVRLTSKYTSGGSTPDIRAAEESFVSGNPRARIVRGDDLNLRDAAHYADVTGYGELGQRCAAALLDIVNNVAPTVPQYIGSGVPVIGAAGTGIVNILPPLNGKAGDLEVLVVAGLGVNPYLAPSGWTQISSSPQKDAGNALNARLQVFTRAWTGAATTVADVASDDSKVGLIFSVRGLGGATPTIDVTAGDATQVAGTAVTLPGVTTTQNNCLVMDILAHRIDLSGPQVSGVTNASLTQLTEQVDYSSTSGQGFGPCVVTGVRATAGVVSATTMTLANSSPSQARIKLAVRP